MVWVIVNWVSDKSGFLSEKKKIRLAAMVEEWLRTAELRCRNLSIETQQGQTIDRKHRSCQHAQSEV